MDVAEAFRRHFREIEATRIFRVKPVLVDGNLQKAYGGDACILRMLNFKGTGEIKSFHDVKVEYSKYALDHVAKSCRGIKMPVMKWIDAWVMERNYRLTFADDDIVMLATKETGTLN